MYLSKIDDRRVECPSLPPFALDIQLDVSPRCEQPAGVLYANRKLH